MLLKKGDNNENVKKLQVRLGVEAIGTFGPKTEEAVKKFQEQKLIEMMRLDQELGLYNIEEQ